MDLFKQMKAMAIVLGIIMAAMGIILLVYPETVINILATAIGALVTAYGGFRTISSIVRRREIPQPALRIALSALLLVCGFYILFNTSITISFISVVIGLFAVILALDRFSTAMSRKKEGLKIGSAVGFGLLHLLFGAAMICMPLMGTSALVMLAGCYLLIGGIAILASACYFRDL